LYFFDHQGASLNFGVFLCSNGSGAHRALGPTITRVKSANLDLWHTDWIADMVLGNKQINSYWEGDPSSQIK
jgi:stromal membrane-associated protein